MPTDKPWPRKWYQEPSLPFVSRAQPLKLLTKLCCCDCSVAKLCPTLCDPMDCNMPDSSVLHHLPEFVQIHVHWVGDAIQPSRLSSILLLLPSVFPSIRVFSGESALCIRWPKYWSFSLSVSLSNEYLGWISFRIDWFDPSYRFWIIVARLPSPGQTAPLGPYSGLGIVLWRAWACCVQRRGTKVSWTLEIMLL